MALAGAGSGAEIMDKGGDGGAEAENKLFLLRNTAFVYDHFQLFSFNLN